MLERLWSFFDEVVREASITHPWFILAVQGMSGSWPKANMTADRMFTHDPKRTW